MDETIESTVEETPTAPTARFNVRKLAKAAAITTGVVAGVVLLKRKLNSSVDGEVTLNVATNDES